MIEAKATWTFLGIPLNPLHWQHSNLCFLLHFCLEVADLEP